MTLRPRSLFSIVLALFFAGALVACDQTPTSSEGDSSSQTAGETAGAEAPSDRVSSDRHIVGLEAGQMKVGTEAASEVYRTFDFGEIGVAVSGKFSEQALEALKNNSNVRYVEENGTMEAHDHTVDEGDGDPNEVQVLPWGIDRVDAEVAQENGETANGAEVTIIDTGIDPDHESLADNVAGGKAWVSCRGGGCSTDWDDDNDHGTHVAGTADAVNNSVGVVGVGTEANLYAAKVLDKRGSGSFDDVAAAIEWSADQGHDVANMSLGASSPSSVVADAVQYADGKGVLLVGSAGNSGPCTDCVGYPAAEPEVVAVSATDSTDALASFSSTGPEVEIAAPGVDVLSTIPGSNYDRFSGTSMSAPHVAGGGAQLMANGSTNDEARTQLKDTAEDIGLGDNEQGAGLLDTAGSLGLDSSDDLSDDGGGDSGGDDPPSVSWLNPSDGDTVSGTVTLEADASDDSSVDQVEFFVDGSSVGTDSDGSDGWTTDWNSENVSDGDHDLTTEATDDAGQTASSTITVTVDNTSDGGGNAPAIDTFALTDNSNPQWARVQVDWDVSDADGDLAEVTTEVTFGNGSTGSETSSVSGSSASGTHELRERNGQGDADVTLTVTDANGNQTTQTKTISLN